jgi:hypothetical protein
MATYRATNFSRKQPKAADGDVFVDCNLAQAAPHTPICAGATNLRFTRCNLSNCDVPAGSIIEDSLTCHVAVVKDAVEEPILSSSDVKRTETTIREVERKDGSKVRYTQVIEKRVRPDGTFDLTGGSNDEEPILEAGP